MGLQNDQDRYKKKLRRNDVEGARRIKNEQMKVYTYEAYIFQSGFFIIRLVESVGASVAFYEGSLRNVKPSYIAGMTVRAWLHANAKNIHIVVE